MMLRWMVSNLLRQAAQDQIRNVVSSAMQGQREPSEAAAIEPLPPIDVVVVFALSIESGGFVDLLKERKTTRCHSHTEHRGQLNGRQVLVAESGVGQAAAKNVTTDVTGLYQPNWVISAGFAGALQPALRRGHILMSEEVADVTGKRLSIGLTVDRAALEASPSLHVGRLLTVDQLVRTREVKEQLGTDHAALACDMETLAVAQACQHAGTKFMSIRIVSDSIDDELPKEIESLLAQASLVGKLGAAAGAIANRPSSVKDLWKLKEDALKATDRLARFVTSVIDQLPQS
ncbi:MAG: nucleoside phosphorylase [Planctomycetaceae bacterium]|nr:nucleoside phosphorylase [Planctomycetaceae bacterium]